ncbi:phage major capsid protein [Falsochrobactrum shanghaiense]|uniref:Phage major capsid protein n=1 Tax=Falsochrobactrum shanghaiense TaxID=2201899 RepID=A0A316JC65_9HYPH|nr:phage major capsid protein [Falsochrobactrum shanghaiense]PWL18831.1 phage major capsid protein [Falsochrobactrum shanghaiense]
MTDIATISALIEKQGAAFEAFKSEHNTALADIRKGQEDVVRTEKVDRINDEIGKLTAAIDDANAKLGALQVSGANEQPAERGEYAKAFDRFFRKGDERELQSLTSGPKASMNVGTPEDGGYTAPTEWDRTIVDKLKIVSPMRQIATVQTISGNGFSKLYNDRNTASGWVGETDARPETSTAKFAEVKFTTGEIYANPAATQRLLDDSEINIESWLAGEVETEFAYQEGLAFVSGDGSNKPRGILKYAAGDTPAHPWGAIPSVKSGAATALKLDGLIDLVYDLPSERTPNARFVMNRKTQGAIRKIKDGNGNFIWQPGLQAGQPASVLGFPVTEMAAMPDVGAGNIPIVFGDFSGYLVIDRMGIRILRDPYTSKPFVMFYTTKRVGGGVTDPTMFRYHTIEA